MRFIVIGTSGSGKSTFARALAAGRGCEYVELDELFWTEGWTPRPQLEFLASARAAALGEHWVMDGNYSIVRDTVWPRGTHIVWLNFSRRTVLLRVLRRTVWRLITRQALWHGNRETLRKAFFSRQSILLWAASTYNKNKHRSAQLRAENPYPHLVWTELCHPRDALAYLRQHGSAGG